MNDTLPSPDVTSQDAAASPPAKLASPRPAAQRLLIATVAIVAALAGWQLYTVRTELERTRADFARRLAETTTAASAAQAVSRQVHDSLDSLQQRVGGLDARLADAASQQDALQSMYQDVMRARDERFLTEVEQAVGIASQQLQLAGNVPAALSALESAEARLSTQSRPQLLAVRKLVARDIERLRALPTADIAGMALHLETMLGIVDALPLGFEHLPRDKKPAPKVAPAKPAVPAAKGKKPADPASAPMVASAASVPSEAPAGFFSGLLDELWSELRQLVRVERLDRAEPALLPPQQAVYLRENLRLRLLSARLGLLQRDARSFAEDVSQARRWLELYFDVDAAPVANMLGELRQMEAARLSVELPSLAETEGALRNLKFGRAN